ncbi:hypothetical protein H6F94_25825 [Leptolyngbya sp. FACHB-261]|nr:hypothetical protein [Leptolyngbya sp. FACHB-261]
MYAVKTAGIYCSLGIS